MLNSSGEMQPDGGECWQGEDAICFFVTNDETFIVRTPDVGIALDIAQTLGIMESDIDTY